MKLIKMTADLSGVKSLPDFYKRMSSLFGFPDFFGNNINALVDCMFNFRYPESEMSEFHISNSECLLLEVLGFSLLPLEVAVVLTSSIEAVNFKCNYKNQPPLILLLLNKTL